MSKLDALYHELLIQSLKPEFGGSKAPESESSKKRQVALSEIKKLERES